MPPGTGAEPPTAIDKSQTRKRKADRPPLPPPSPAGWVRLFLDVRSSLTMQLWARIRGGAGVTAPSRTAPPPEHLPQLRRRPLFYSGTRDSTQSWVILSLRTASRLPGSETQRLTSLYPVSLSPLAKKEDSLKKIKSSCFGGCSVTWWFLELTAGSLRIFQMFPDAQTGSVGLGRAGHRGFHAGSLTTLGGQQQCWRMVKLVKPRLGRLIRKDQDSLNTLWHGE